MTALPGRNLIVINPYVAADNDECPAHLTSVRAFKRGCYRLRRGRRIFRPMPWNCPVRSITVCTGCCRNPMLSARRLWLRNRITIRTIFSPRWFCRLLGRLRRAVRTISWFVFWHIKPPIYFWGSLFFANINCHLIYYNKSEEKNTAMNKYSALYEKSTLSAD